MKLIKSLFLGLIMAFVFLVILAVSISLIYEKEVAQYFVEELNESINAKISVDDIKFSLLRKFPDASLELKSVTAHSPSTFKNNILGHNTDTLFSAKRLFLQFNILDLLTKNYSIKNIHFDQGIINVFVDIYGNENYRFWNSIDNKSNEAFKLELNKIKITQTHILYCNEYQNIVYSGSIEKANLKGLFFEESFSLDANASMVAENFSLDNYNYILNKTLSIRLLLEIDEKAISFTKGDISLESFDFAIAGNILRKNNLQLNLSLIANNQSFEGLLYILPNTFRNEFSNIQNRGGDVTFNTTIIGELSKTNNPKIQGSFQIKKTNLIELSNKIRINQVYADGVFSNGNKNCLETTSVKIDSFSAALDKSTANGSCIISNFNNPSLLINYSADFDFAEIQSNFSIDTLEILTGLGKIKGTFSGNLKEIKDLKFYDFFKKEFAFNLRIKNGQFKLKGNPLVVNNVSGLFAINETLYTDSLYFKILDNDFLLIGEASNLYNYFSSDGITSVIAELLSESIDLNQLSPVFFVEKSEKKDPSYKFPDRLNLFLNLQVNNFTVGKFNATEIKGSLNYKPKMFSLHEISFNSMNGWSKLGGVVIQNYKNDFIVRVQSNLKTIDIGKLFYSFNSFGQSFLPEKNIKGDISGDIYFSSSFSEKLEINRKSIVAESSILIQNGALVSYEPLKRLSTFIDVKELENIKFSSLQNQITIKDEKVFIPRMDIVSSALNLTIFGTHNFDNTFDYHFKVLLSDILAKNAKDKAKKDDEFENVEDDGMGKTNIYLKIVGNPDDYKVSYDRKQAREARKEEQRTEKQQLKKLLNEEFGWYKSDSTIVSDTLGRKKVNAFKIEWEETPTSKEPIKKDKEIETSPKFEISFDEDTIPMHRE